LVATNAEDLGVAFSGGPYYGSNGVVLYTSFSVKFSYLPGSPGSYFLHFAPTIAELSSFNCKVFAGRPTLASTTFRLGIANYAGGMMDEFPRDLSLNTTYWVVTRFDSGTGESVLWVNPGSEQSPSAVATDSPGAYTVGSIHLRQADYEGDMAIGPIKIGTSWSDVYTAPVLNYTVNGSGQLVLSWSNPLLSLQHASVVTGPYTTLAATSPYTNSFSGPQYFRLGY
jgi:hypothetical protein